MARFEVEEERRPGLTPAVTSAAIASATVASFAIACAAVWCALTLAAPVSPTAWKLILFASTIGCGNSLPRTSARSTRGSAARGVGSGCRSLAWAL